LLLVNDIRKATKKSENYIVVPNNNKTGFLIFNEYKTSNRYETLKYEIRPEVMKLIKDSLETNNLEYNKDDYLLFLNMKSSM
jgi:hypothetical protein